MKTKKNKASKDDLTAGDRVGIKGLNKGKRRKLEAYQHLFYLLQVIQNVYFYLIYPKLKSLIKISKCSCRHTLNATPSLFPTL